MRASRKSLFKSFEACGPPANHFLKVLKLAGLPQIIPQKVWCFRGWRKSFPEGFGISALGESHFPKGLAFPRMSKVISRRVWHFRARRKSFPERFGISALGEISFTKKRQNIEINITRIYHIFKVNPESYLSNFRGFCLFLGGCNLFNKSKKTLCVRNVQRGEYVL